MRLLSAVLLLLVAGMLPARAERADVEITNEEGYGRIVINFADRNILPAHRVSSSNGVLVLQFDDSFDMDVQNVPVVLNRYVTIARADPEGRGARFALSRSTRVNTMEAGGKLFIDFLPAEWVGPPPQLPVSVIEELAKKAEDATRMARQAEMLKMVGSKVAKIDVRVARTPTFSRFVFKWNIPFEATFAREDAGVVISFNRDSPVDLSEIQANMPPFVDDITSKSDEQGLSIMIGVQPVADVRAYREDNSYVVDVQGPVDEASMSPIDAAIHDISGTDHSLPDGASHAVTSKGNGESDKAETGHAASEADMALDGTMPDPHGSPDPHAPTTAHVTDAPVHSAEAPAHGTEAPAHATEAPAHATEAPAHATEVSAHGTEAPAHVTEAPAHGAAPANEVASHGSDGHDMSAPAAVDHGAATASGEAASAGTHEAVSSAEHPPEMASEHADQPATGDAHPVDHAAVASGEGTAHLAELPEGNDRVLTDDTIRVESKRVGQSTRLVFPYKKPIGSAMFTRGTALWLVFDDPSPIDPAPLQDALAGFARSIQQIKVGDAQALRIELAEPLLSSASPDGSKWVITIGDMVMQPTRALPVKRAVRENGETVLDVPFGPVNAIHEIPDDTTGDKIIVITGTGEPRGLIKPQSFAEVDALASAHGLAFVPRTDDIQVSVANELVTVQRPGGLSVSTAPPPRQVGVLDLPNAIGSGLGARAGFIDFGDLEAAKPGDYWKKRHDVFSLITQTRDKAERVDRWYKAARFNIANGLGPEGLGILDLIAKIAPEEATSERMAALRAAASTLMYRPRDVLAALDRPEFADSPDASVWRAIALADLGNFQEARKSFPRGEGVIGNFPSTVQKRFLLSGVTTAIELNDYGKAASLLSQIDPKTLNEEEKGQLDLLNARAADSNGHPADAMELLSNIVRTRNGPVAAEATLRLVNLQRREGLITLDQGLDRLEQLAVSWRGDDIELNTLRTIGQYSVEKADYRRAFEVKRTAEAINPNSPTTRLVEDEMQAAFASLFIDGKADQMKPVDALALYYDFRELTPPGRRGDSMVRKLANRLVDVDLLPQAAALLDYQIENRLRGAARAEVAADLGMIYLLDKHPEKALLTLSRTRQAELPATIERQRRTIEAKALAETGKVDLALDLLKPVTGGDIDRMRTDILWDAQRYEEAGTEIEKQLGKRWNEPLPLSDPEQLAVLKAGISYALTGDRIGLERLRSKFAAKMAESPNASAFEAVTGPIVANGTSLDDVVRSIAAIDSMQNFLNDYRARYSPSNGNDKPQLIDNSAQSAADPAATAPKAG